MRKGSRNAPGLQNYARLALRHLCPSLSASDTNNLLLNLTESQICAICFGHFVQVGDGPTSEFVKSNGLTVVGVCDTITLNRWGKSKGMNHDQLVEAQAMLHQFNFVVLGIS